MMVSGAPKPRGCSGPGAWWGQKANGKAAELSGMSLFWSNTGWGGERYHNAGAVKAVKTFSAAIWFGWRSVSMRVAVTFSDREGNLARARAAIDAAIANDLWRHHRLAFHYAHEHEAEAIAFFKGHGHATGKESCDFEIFNEPKMM